MGRSGFGGATIVGVVAVLAAVLFSPAMHAQRAPRACTIESPQYGAEPLRYQAECFYDEAGTLLYWVFSVVSSTDPANPTGGTATDNAIPHRVSITGFPKVWKAQKDYRGGDFPMRRPEPGFSAIAREIERIWNERQKTIESTWQNQEASRRSDRILNRTNPPIPALLPNRTSPFLPLFHQPSNIEGDLPRSADMQQFCSNYPNIGSCRDRLITTDDVIRAACGTTPGCDVFDPIARRWRYDRCRRVTGSSCDVYLKIPPTADDVISSYFDAWVLARTIETMDFPPARVAYYPGALNVETLRLPLYEAARSLAWHWNQAWSECWEATPAGQSFDGCGASLREYLSGSAVAKAASKRYPSRRAAVGASIVAKVIDAANQFHATTQQLPRFVKPIWGDRIEYNHLEPDDLPADLSADIQAAEGRLNAAVEEMRSYWWR